MPEWAGYIVGAAIALSPTALAVLASALLSRQSKEEWKLLAWVPPAPLVVWWIWLGVAMLRDRTSHNLWPLEMLLWIAVTAALFAVFLLARRFLAPREGSSPWRR